MALPFNDIDVTKVKLESSPRLIKVAMNFIKSLFCSNEYKNIDEPSKSLAEIWHELKWFEDDKQSSLLAFKKEKADALVSFLINATDISYQYTIDDDDKASALEFEIKKYRSLSELYKVDSPKLDFAMECENIEYKIYILIRTLTGLISLLLLKKPEQRTVGIQVTMKN